MFQQPPARQQPTARAIPPTPPPQPSVVIKKAEPLPNESLGSPEKKDKTVPLWEEVKPEKRPTQIPTGGYKSKWQP